MAGLLDLFSGRSSDIYGNGLLTPEQRGGLGNIGLLALAGKLGQLAGPSFSPVPDFGAALGQAAGAYGASQEGAGTAALNAILTGQRGRKLEQELDYYKQLGPVLSKLGGQWPGADGGTAATPETGSTGSTGGGAAAPPGAGGGGGPGSDPRGMIPHITAEATRLGIDPAVALQVARSEGLGIFSGDKGKSGGAFQLYTGGGMGNDFIRDTGLDPLDPKNEKATITYALEQAAQKGWGAWNGAKALGITGFAGIGKPGAAPTAAAPVGAGGLLAPTAPNPLSDAEPMVGIPRPAARPQTAAAPGGEAALVQRYADETAGTPNPPSYPEWKARLGGSIIDRTQGFGPMLGRPIAPSGGGGPLAAPPGAGGDPIMSVTSADQAGGGDAPAAAAPRSPLPTMGPAGIELPPMQGPLATPAPAAAAPAAPGPGLLSPPGMPAAAALPRVNPAYDAYLRNLGIAGVLAKGAGLPDVFSSLTGALKDSPAYAAQLEIARKSAGLPFIGPETTAAEEAKSKFVGPNAAAIAAAQDPFIKGQELFKNQMKMLGEGRVWDAEAGTFVSAPGFAQTLLDQEIAKAKGAKSQDTTTKIVRGADGRDYTVTVPLVEYLQELRDNLGKNQQPGTAPATGQGVGPGQTVPQPIVTKTDEQRGDVLGGEYKDIATAADAAEKARFPLSQIEAAMPDFRTGQTAQTRLLLGKMWQDFASNIGLPTNEGLGKEIAAGEIINKSGTTLGFDLARTLGSREAQNIVQQAIAANPGLGVTPGGNKELISLIKQGLQRETDKRVFFDNWYARQRNYEGAATAFNNTAPVEKYVSQVLPYKAATPSDAAKYPPGTRVMDPYGNVRIVPPRPGQ